MKLKEAIERLQYSLDHNTLLITWGDDAALKLLIEAGERIQKGRATFDEYYATLLPSETTE